MLIAAKYLWHGKQQGKYEKGGNNAVQSVKILVVNRDKNAATGFSMCIKPSVKAKNRDLGFTSVRLCLPILGQHLIIRKFYLGFLSY